MLSGKATQIRRQSDRQLYVQVTINSPESYFLYKFDIPASFMWKKTTWIPVQLVENPHRNRRLPSRMEATDRFYTGAKRPVLRRNAQIAEIDMTLNSTTSDMIYLNREIDLTNPSAAYYDQDLDPSGLLIRTCPNHLLECWLHRFNCKEAPFNDPISDKPSVYHRK